MFEIKISDWSKYPIGRTVGDSPTNGATYRDKILIPCLINAAALNMQLRIDIRNVNFTSSWIEEVFYNIIKNSGIDKNFFDSNVKFISDSRGINCRHLDVIRYFLAVR